MMEFFAENVDAEQGIFDFLDLPSTGFDHWSDHTLSGVDFALSCPISTLPISDDISPLSSPSSSSTDSPASSPDALAQSDRCAFIKSEPVSPSSPQAGSVSRSAKRQRSPSNGVGALRIKSEARYSDDESSDEAEFDPDAMPHPSIFTKTPSQLTKEELLSLTTKGLEEYERRVKTFHTLTNSEQNLLKRQRRLIKNRESAQQSRMRKKAYVQDLERHVKRLMSEKEELLRMNQDLVLKNDNLQRHVNILQDAVRNNGGASNSSSNSNSDPFQIGGPGKKAVPRAAGVCALVVLFSFALFFGMSGNSSPGAVRPAAIPLASSGLNGPSSGSPEWNTGRLLTSVSSNASIAAIDDEIDIDSSHLETLRAPDSPIVDITSLDDSDDETSSPGLSSAFIKQENRASAAIVSSSYARKASSIPASYTESAVVRVRSDEQPRQRDHLGTPSYIYCAEAQQLVPVETTSVADKDDYPLISLLLPASSLDTTLLRLLEPSDLKLGMDKQKDTLLELSCHVLSVEVFPLAGRGNDFGVVALSQ